MSAAAAVAAWLGASRDATLMSYLLPAETPPAVIRAALAEAGGAAEPERSVRARRDALLAAAAGDAAAEATARDEIMAAEPRFRALAAWALGRLATPAALQALGAAVAHEPDPVVRQAALRALGAAGDAARGAAGAVAAIAEDPAEPEALRALARRVAARLGPPAPEPAPPAPPDEPAADVALDDAAPEAAAELDEADAPDAGAGAAPAEAAAAGPDDAEAPPPAPAAPAGPRLAFGQGEAATAEPEPPPDDPLLAALVALRPGLTGSPLRARVVHALALQGFAIEADLVVPDRGDGRPGAIDLLATRGDEAIALVLGDELPAYAALLALGQVTATARGVVLGAAGLTHVPEFADWLVAGGRWRRRGSPQA